jgi:hypothetical protein
MQSVNTYYRHSGKFSPAGLFWMPLYGMIAAVFFGFIYAYVIHYILYIPLIRWFGFFMPVFFGVIVGALTGQGGKVGRVRNTAVAFASGLLAGLLAVYAGWVFWIFSLTDPHLLPLNPLQLLGGLLAVSEKGTWGYGGLAPTGIVLWIFWLIEALLIAGGSAFMARLFLQGVPFCELCGRWVATEVKVGPLAPLADPAAAKAELEGGRFTVLTGLRKTGAEAAEFTALKLMQCEGCRQFHLLTVKKGGTMKDKDGKETKTESALLENFIIDGGLYEALSRLA